MRISPLNLISTPVGVVNSLGLDLNVGLSSQDPMVGRNPTEPYEAYLTVFSPDGMFIDRIHLGQVPPNRRSFFPISDLTRDLVPNLDHLAIVHRVPSRMTSNVNDLSEEIELKQSPDYSLFRSYVEYSYPGGGNGSVVYDTPPGINGSSDPQRSSNALTFTCQTLLSERLNTHMMLINYSVNPSYSRTAEYTYALHSLSGERVAMGKVVVGPFQIRVLDVSSIIPEAVVEQERDTKDGLSSFTFVGYSQDAAILMVVLSLAPSVLAVGVEHTHPPQTYMLSVDSSYQKTVKTDAQNGWKSILHMGQS